ncbi:regulatory protein [Alloactinosynnema sp. L-07]|uniref:response regulator transcription factor n=1 Tax=Alloactinosynnema sp. L-07 TaxID=1653480 RepID=UPI00065F02FA|nr:response regulator transcription factor [Alloactinosynnema sp. L-07]CRK56197.1 regulatory protein [Alloactinosynnema sp. L-07]
MTLRDLGFDERTEQVYRVLLDEPACGLADLAARFGIDVEVVDKAISALVALGVARRDGAGPVALLSPGAALGELIERIEDALLREHRRVGATRAEVAELAARHERRAGPSADNGIERIEDLGAVRAALEDLSFFTRISVFAVQPGGPQSAEALAASKPLDLRGLRRGLDMRVIYDAAVLSDEVNRAYLRELGEAGAQYRVSDVALERMIVMDGKVAVVPIDPADSGKGALIVRQPGLITGFLRLFQRIWDDARELPWVERTTEPDLTDEDRQVLAHMASGGTDDGAARMLGVSVRHLRRRIARLMDRLDAGSRFEAGAEAARRGWI